MRSSSARRRPTLDETLVALRTVLPGPRERYGVISLAVFGSYARGEDRDRSDVDVLVEFARAPDIFRYMDLEAELRALLGVKVDLVSRKALRGTRGERILRETVVL